MDQGVLEGNEMSQDGESGEQQSSNGLSMDGLCQQELMNEAADSSKSQVGGSSDTIILTTDVTRTIELTEPENEPGGGDGVDLTNQIVIESQDDGEEPKPVTTIASPTTTATHPSGQRSDLTRDAAQVNEVETIPRHELKIAEEEPLQNSSSSPDSNSAVSATINSDPIASTSTAALPFSTSPSKVPSQVLVLSNVHYNPSGHSIPGPSSIHYNSPSHHHQHHQVVQSHQAGHHRPSHQLNFDEIIEEISSNTSSNSSHGQDVGHELGHDLYGHHYLNSYHPDQESVSPSMNVHPPSNDVDLDTNIELISSTPLEIVQEPVIIRGNGNMTLFGLSNTFNNEFPSRLIGHVSKEEFEVTINKINNLLKSHHSTNAKILLLGCLCCCCSFGCSLLWPTIALSKRTRNSLEKLINIENHRMYHKLGLNWKIDKQRCHSNHAFMEYVLVIEFIPKLHIYQPD